MSLHCLGTMHRCGLYQVLDHCTLHPNEKPNITFNKVHKLYIHMHAGLQYNSFSYVIYIVVSCADCIFFILVYIYIMHLCVEINTNSYIMQNLRECA